MCGIVGAVGIKNTREYLINSLKELDYRGYDSAGVAFNDARGITCFKTMGSVEKLDSLISYDDSKVFMGIGHTRWATHGEPSTINSHPHLSMNKKFAIVHNGVIDNYQAIKDRLIKKGYTFLSSTDSEIIANLLEEQYEVTHEILDAIHASINLLEGSFALVIISSYDKDNIYFAKNRSPLLIGVGDGFNLLASDALAMIKKTTKFIDLKDYQYGYANKNEVKVFKDKKEIKVEYSERIAEFLNRDLNDYPHYMLKEIEEAPSCIKRVLNNYFDGSNYTFDENIVKEIRDAHDIIFLACGTSYHASLVGKHFFEVNGKHCEVFIASEWAYNPTVISKNPFFIIMSQSGETADLIRCMGIINAKKYHSLTITNTKGSTLERDATHSLLLYAGIEVAVASTKAYISQVALLSMLVGSINNDFTSITNLKEVIKAQQTIISNKKDYEFIAEQIKNSKDVFFLGRGLDYISTLEASLKLKEITYIHSEAIPGGELKHGPIALIDKGTPVIVFISDNKVELPIRSNIYEVESRGAKVISIVSSSLKKEKDTIIIPDVNSSFAPLLSVLVAQYIAYYTALKLNLNIDKPRNLAKSVTVE